MMRLLFFLAVVLTRPAWGDDNDSQPAANLAGTWKLVRSVNFIDGKEESPFGKKPRGYFTYTPGGQVSSQIQHEEQPQTWRPLETGSDGFGTDSPWYVGYFGRYSVDGNTVVHHVEGGALLHYTGADQKRPFHLSGHQLMIGETGVWERNLVRVK